MTAAGQVLRRLLVTVAAVALISHGGVEMAPRLVAAGASAASASSGTPTIGRPASSRPAAESRPAERGSAARSTLVAAVTAGAPGPAAGPGSASRVVPHLLGNPVGRPPTSGHVLEPGGAASGRAPPAPAGT